KGYRFYLLKYEKGKWGVFPPNKPYIGLNKVNEVYTIDYMLTWLNQNVTDSIKEGMMVVVYSLELIHGFLYMSEEEQKEIVKCAKNVPILITCTHPNLDWSYEAVLVPDPWVLGDGYRNTYKQLIEHPFPALKDRKPVVYFRGAFNSPYSVPFTMRNALRSDRLNLGLLSFIYPWIDVGYTQYPWVNDTALSKQFVEWFSSHPLSRKGAKSENFITHGQNKYLISIDGFGAAWTRLPYILCTGSVLLARADCHQYFYKLLQKGETHYSIKSGLINLEEAYKDLEEHPKLAEKIARQGKEFAKNYLNPNAIDFYLKTVIYQLNEAYKPNESIWSKLKLQLAKLRFEWGI
ncbi:MAG TPA: glycosyl transferase family 90, partial [Alphaproteobacteria bacterium]|nr:glycosyl transferase family 90 [Alphaproteobacteria bacterium]